MTYRLHNSLVGLLQRQPQFLDYYFLLLFQEHYLVLVCCRYHYKLFLLQFVAYPPFCFLNPYFLKLYVCQEIFQEQVLLRECSVQYPVCFFVSNALCMLSFNNRSNVEVSSLVNVPIITGVVSSNPTGLSTPNSL